MSAIDLATGVSVLPPPRHPAWRHQLAARDFVMRKVAGGRHGLMLALAMGTGKSKTAIDLIPELEAKTVLVACPMRVVQVWHDELDKHASFGYIFRALDDRAGTIKDKVRIARDAMALARVARQVLVIAVNYETVWQAPFSTWALANLWSLVIADEIHRLKQPDGKISRFMGRLGARARYRLGLSGTPMPHSPLDVWAQYRFLDPTIYDETFHSFKTRYAILGGFERRQVVNYRDLDDLRTRFYSIAYRVEKAEALDLPPTTDQQLYADLGSDGRKVYNNLDRDFLAWLAETPESQLTVDNALVKLLRLAQLTGGTLKDDQGVEHFVDMAKEKLLEDLLIDLEPDEPAVIFGRFHADLDAMARACERAGRSWVEVSGRSKDGIARWKKHEADILLAQIQVAGEGQDFTRARYAVFYSIGFSLAQYLQARDRIHRPGQARPVVYYHLLIRDSVDEIIQRAIENRWELVESVLKEMKQRVASR